MSGFVHLHLHSEFSLVDGLVRLGPLVERLGQLAMPACAVTDQNNLFAMVKFHKAAIAAGIKPIVGVDVRVSHPQTNEPPTRLVLLCRNLEGYGNLTRLISRAFQEGQESGTPVLKRGWFDLESCRGLIALSGGREGEVGRGLLSSQPEAGLLAARHWSAIFPDSFYLELIRTGREDEERYLHAAVDLALAEDLPVVASNDVRFLCAEDFEAHEARVCIHEGRALDDQRRPRLYSREQYLRSPEEMAELFADVPEALENSVEIARRCSLSLSLGQNFLPAYPVPEGRSIDEHLREQSRDGLTERLAHGIVLDPRDPEGQRARYQARLELELDVICQMGFPGYFLIVADFIQWAKDNGVPVGPGRGSGAGSLVAYALKITDLDPIHYDLLFERFLNPERVSMPDFDVDFCMVGRDRVIEYVSQRYGRERVSQIITYGTMAAKAVVRDVARVLGHSYGFGDRIAKMIPMEIGMTLDKALSQEDELRQAYQNDDEVRQLIDLAKKLEGLARNAGKHAGGVVIAPTALTDFSPLFCEPGGQGVVTHFDKDDVEAIGLVKFDFLGLRTLTIIDWAMKTVNAQRRAAGQPELLIADLPLDDKASYELLKRHETTAVFQLESRGMKDLIKRLQPDDFEDIVALVALYRPGPLQSGMVDDYINRKHGRAKVEYPHPALESILKPTHGVILYQEQVMQIAQVLAGYSLGGADLLRRAMGKKKAEEMAKQREIFVAGALQQDVEQGTASHIFDLMEKFAGYGFNKSHSAAYALLSYQTAWLKAHHPAAFMAAVLSADMDHTDKIVNLVEECRSMNLRVIPPDINSSGYQFTVRDESTIVYGLGAIKGVGEAAIQVLLEARAGGGAFASLEDLCLRLDSQKINRRTLEALIRAGALDSIGPNRASLILRLPRAMSLAEQHLRDRELGQTDLFGGPAVPEAGPEQIPMIPEWDQDMLLQAEKETLGLYLTGHPISRYEEEIAQITGKRIADLLAEIEDLADSADGAGPGRRRKEQDVLVAGLVVGIRSRNGQSGRMAFVGLDDRSGRLEVGLFGEDFRRYQPLLGRDRLLVVEGSAAVDDFSGQLRVRCRRLMDLDQAREAFARRLEIGLEPGADEAMAAQLREHLLPYREGPCPVLIQFYTARARATLRLAECWQVRPAETLLQRLRGLDGVASVSLFYR